MCFFVDLSQLADSRKKCTRFFKAAFYLGSISAVFSSPVFDPAGSFSQTAAGNRAYFLLKKSPPGGPLDPPLATPLHS